VLAARGDQEVLVGCLDLSDMAIEAPETVVARVKRALPDVPRRASCWGRTAA
jgi:methionine synthase II (cobalamin-independent)